MRLTLTDGSRSEPELPGTGEVVIRDRDETPVAYGWSADGCYAIRVVDVATFRFRAGDDELVAAAEPGVPHETVLDAYANAALPLALQICGGEVLHASAVRLRDGGVVAFCGLSESGKSTIAYALARRGHELWADNVVALEVAPGGTVTCLRLPFELRLRSATARHFDEDVRPFRADLGGGPSGAADPLEAVFLLDRTHHAAPVEHSIRRLSASEALAGLLPHGFRFTLLDADPKRRTVAQYVALSARVPVFRARFTSGLDRLPELLDRIEEAVTSTR